MEQRQEEVYRLSGRVIGYLVVESPHSIPPTVRYIPLMSPTHGIDPVRLRSGERVAGVIPKIPRKIEVVISSSGNQGESSEHS